MRCRERERERGCVCCVCICVCVCARARVCVCAHVLIIVWDQYYMTGTDNNGDAPSNALPRLWATTIFYATQLILCQSLFLGKRKTFFASLPFQNPHHCAQNLKPCQISILLLSWDHLYWIQLICMCYLISGQLLLLDSQRWLFWK